MDAFLQFVRLILFVLTLFHKKEYILRDTKALPNRSEYVLAFT